MLQKRIWGLHIPLAWQRLACPQFAPGKPVAIVLFRVGIASIQIFGVRLAPS